MLAVYSRAAAPRTRTWLACLVLVACDRGAPPSDAPAAPAVAATPAPSAPPVRDVVVTTALASADAFDLVATVEGAVLVWAEAGACDHALRAAALDARGQVRFRSPDVAMQGCAHAERVAPERARITELAAGSGAGRVGLVWVAEDDAAHEVFGGYGDESARRWAPPFALGPTVAATAPRGRVSMTSGESGALRVSFRGESGACVAQGAGQCAHYVARAHPPPPPESGRGVETREIPDPCDRLLAGSVWVGGVWYDGVCSRGPEPITQVFAIRPEISYAEAVPSLPGCEPAGLAPASVGAVLWGDCPQGPGARLLSPGGIHDMDLRDVQREAECRDGRPVLRVIDASGAGFELPLGAPLSRLEGYLTPPLARDGSRAVWAGEALVIASTEGASLRVESHRCHRGALVRWPP